MDFPLITEYVFSTGKALHYECILCKYYGVSQLRRTRSGSLISYFVHPSVSFLLDRYVRVQSVQIYKLIICRFTVLYVCQITIYVLHLMVIYIYISDIWRFDDSCIYGVTSGL